MLDVINKRFKVRFIALILLTLILALAISAVTFYSYTNKALGETYAQKINTIVNFKTTVIKDTLLIFIPPAIIAAVFAIIAIVLYTHKIVGPLVRIKAVTRQISEGNLDSLIKFREKDAIQPLANALNKVSSNYNERLSALSNILDEMSKKAQEMHHALETKDSETAEARRKELGHKAEEINNILSKIKL